MSTTRSPGAELPHLWNAFVTPFILTACALCKLSYSSFCLLCLVEKEETTQGTDATCNPFAPRVFLINDKNLFDSGKVSLVDTIVRAAIAYTAIKSYVSCFLPTAIQKLEALLLSLLPSFIRPEDQLERISTRQHGDPAAL